jgi:RNA polymerase sigma factor (sigma-70 family)
MELLSLMKCIRSDEELVEQFVTGTRDDAERAFESLVRRHGPLVMGICRQVLSRHQDAEDAFQATFLVVARKARGIRDRRVFGPWLCEVAYRTAIRMKSRARLRPRLLRMADREASVGGPESAAARRELRLHVRAELESLPEKYRFLVEQCYLEGKTNQEVALLLDRPVGTIKGWLSRARGMLRQRLSGAVVDRDDFGDRAGAARRA